jgi:SAM-dependent methyltransferase
VGQLEPALRRPGAGALTEAGTQTYDRIGRGYATCRRPDPRIAARLHAALAGCRSVLNVGAGAGSYEPTDRVVVALEPSRTMIAQRAPGGAPVVCATAEQVPCATGAFDATLAILTLHHWRDRARGLRELRRVARRRVVLLTYDPPRAATAFWLVAHYLPAVHGLDAPRFPSCDELAAALGPIDVHPVPIPADCTDGFLGAYWRRPEAYLDPAVRRGISVFAQLPPAVVADGLGRLGADLASGAWDARFGHLRALDALDLGYRLVVSGGAA